MREQLANPKNKHIEIATRPVPTLWGANATTKALSKSLLFRPEKKCNTFTACPDLSGNTFANKNDVSKNRKISADSQKLNLPTHKPAEINNLTIKLYNIDIQIVKYERKKNHYPQQSCVRTIAGEVVNQGSVHLINFCGGGKVIDLKSATALILYR